jgi:hypothetical protein
VNRLQGAATDYRRVDAEKPTYCSNVASGRAGGAAICYIPETLRHETRPWAAADRIVVAGPWTLAGVPM